MACLDFVFFGRADSYSKIYPQDLMVSMLLWTFVCAVGNAREWMPLVFVFAIFPRRLVLLFGICLFFGLLLKNTYLKRQSLAIFYIVVFVAR